ncbi:MAG: hypothetical protein ACPGYX_07505, partial [Oceanobacter sp.]
LALSSSLLLPALSEEAGVSNKFFKVFYWDTRVFLIYVRRPEFVYFLNPDFCLFDRNQPLVM